MILIVWKTWHMTDQLQETLTCNKDTIIKNTSMSSLTSPLETGDFHFDHSMFAYFPAKVRWYSLNTLDFFAS